MATIFTHSLRRASGLLQGMGSILCLFPSNGPVRHGPAADAEALSGDFDRVGTYIGESMRRLANQPPADLTQNMDRQLSFPNFGG